MWVASVGMHMGAVVGVGVGRVWVVVWVGVGVGAGLSVCVGVGVGGVWVWARAPCSLDCIASRRSASRSTRRDALSASRNAPSARREARSAMAIAVARIDSRSADSGGDDSSYGAPCCWVSVLLAPEYGKPPKHEAREACGGRA